jgi:hypothetical protein
VNLKLLIEILASVTMGVGTLYGSTTVTGAGFLLFSQVFWWTICIRHRMWGIIPATTMMTVISAVNLWRAL